MRAEINREQSRLTVSFEEPKTPEDFLAEVRSSGGFLVVLDRELPQFGKLAVALLIDEKDLPAFEATVAQVFPGQQGSFQTAFLVEDWSEANERSLRKQLLATTGNQTAADEEPETGEMQGVAAVHRIQQMNPGQKARLANRADRSERQVLLRDSSAQVLQGLLANPRIEAKEVLQIVRSTHANGGLLQRIVGDGRWGKNQEILAAAVRNPKTPTPLATRLVDKLRTSDLRPMAKMSGGVKEVIRRAALREYMKRTGR